MTVLINNEEIEIDSDIWDTLVESDLKEVIEEDVRSRDYISEWVD